MSDEALLVARVLFWALTAGLALLPMRWATVCLILACTRHHFANLRVRHQRGF